nr:unnamed protein product [Digitaria exilis]
MLLPNTARFSPPSPSQVPSLLPPRTPVCCAPTPPLHQSVLLAPPAPSATSVPLDAPRAASMERPHAEAPRAVSMERPQDEVESRRRSRGGSARRHRRPVREHKLPAPWRRKAVLTPPEPERLVREQEPRAQRREAVLEHSLCEGAGEEPPSHRGRKPSMAQRLLASSPPPTTRFLRRTPNEMILGDTI